MPIDFDETVIERKHVRMAIRRFLRNPRPPRPARSAFLIHGRQRLPAKHIVRLAFEAATNHLPRSEQLTGGRASVRVLENLGFNAIYERTTLMGGKRNKVKRVRRESFCAWLEQHFGEVRTEHKSERVTIPDLRGRRTLTPTERSILSAIESVRDYTVDGSAGRKLSFDFYLPRARLLIEFDERQHFTPARAAALRAYPRGLRLGFDRARWIRLCDEIRAGDNQPKYRDEQRAFYDSLRDLAPGRLGFPPLVRVFEDDVRWERARDQRCPDAEKLLARMKRSSRPPR